MGRPKNATKAFFFFNQRKKNQTIFRLEQKERLAKDTRLSKDKTMQVWTSLNLSSYKFIQIWTYKLTRQVPTYWNMFHASLYKSERANLQKTSPNILERVYLSLCKSDLANLRDKFKHIETCFMHVYISLNVRAYKTSLNILQNVSCKFIQV